MWKILLLILLAQAPLTIKVSPEISMGSTVELTIRIVPSEENREICMGWVNHSDETERRSCQLLHGEKIIQQRYTALLPGDYSAFATLYTSTYSPFTASHPFSIIPPSEGAQ